MADDNVSLEFMDNYARIKKMLWNVPKQPTVFIPKKVIEPIEPPPPEPVKIDLDLIKKMDIFGIPDDPLLRGIKRLKVAKIVYPVLKKNNTPWAFILNKCRRKEYHWPRYEVYWALFVNGYGFAPIGRIVDRDHSTVIYGVEKWKREKGSDYSEYLITEAVNAWGLSDPSSLCADDEEHDEADAKLE